MLYLTLLEHQVSLLIATQASFRGMEIPSASSGHWQLITVDQGARPVQIAVDSQGRVLAAPGQPLIAPPAPATPVLLKAVQEDETLSQSSGASKLSKRRQALPRGLASKVEANVHNEKAETASDSGTDVSWWHDRLTELGDPCLPVMQEIPEDFAVVDTSVDDAAKTILAQASLGALSNRRARWRALMLRCAERRKAYTADPTAMSKRNALGKWVYLVTHKVIQRRYADEGDLLKGLKKDRTTEGIIASTPKEPKPKAKAMGRPKT